MSIFQESATFEVAELKSQYAFVEALADSYETALMYIEHHKDDPKKVAYILEQLAEFQAKHAGEDVVQESAEGEVVQEGALKKIKKIAKKAKQNYKDTKEQVKAGQKAVDAKAEEQAKAAIEKKEAKKEKKAAKAAELAAMEEKVQEGMSYGEAAKELGLSLDSIMEAAFASSRTASTETDMFAEFELPGFDEKK